MPKLSKEELQFIDNYLNNSDIIHADIRMEITDHVASEIEYKMQTTKNASFYEVFKTYMVENKTDLFSDNKRYIKSVVNKNFKQLIKELVSIKTLIVFVSLLFLSKYYLVDSNIVSRKYLFQVPVIFILTSGILYFIGAKFYKYSRFSGVERMGAMYFLLVQGFHFFSMFIRHRIDDYNNVLVSSLFAMCITLIYVFVKVTVTIIISYSSKYKSMA